MCVPTNRCTCITFAIVVLFFIEVDILYLWCKYTK
nr:MAG TPA: hypothetical protein [Caudoviricetes sp.]